MDPALLINPAFWADTTAIAAGNFPDALPNDPRITGHILFQSSGSSGAPKWIALSKQALLISARAVNHHLSVTTSSCWGLTLPTHHVGGFGVAARAFEANCQLKTLTTRWNPATFSTWIREHQITHTSLVPTQVHDLVTAKLTAPNHMIAIVVGGGRLDQSIGQAARHLGWPVLASYGMTETGSQIATQPLASLNTPYQPAPLPLLPIWQAQTSNNKILSLRGPALFSGVISHDHHQWIYTPRLTEWFQSSDRVQLDDSGLTPLGRADLLVKVLGELVDLDAIEQELIQIANGYLTRGSFIIAAIPDPRAEHALVPVFDASADPQSIIDILAVYQKNALGFCRLQTPVFLTNFPHSALGKPRRADIQQQLSRHGTSRGIDNMP